MPRGEAHLDGPNQLGCVVGVNPGRRGRVEAGKDPVQPRTSALLRGLAQPFAQRFVAFGAGEEALGQSPEIQAGSPGHDGKPAAGGNFVEDGAGRAAVGARGEWLIGIGDIDQMVGNAGALFWSDGLAVPRSMPR